MSIESALPPEIADIPDIVAPDTFSDDFDTTDGEDVGASSAPLEQPLVYTRMDGTVEMAANREEVFAKCPVMREMHQRAPAQANLLFSMAERGAALRQQEEKKAEIIEPQKESIKPEKAKKKDYDAKNEEASDSLHGFEADDLLEDESFIQASEVRIVQNSLRENKSTLSPEAVIEPEGEILEDNEEDATYLMEFDVLEDQAYQEVQTDQVEQVDEVPPQMVFEAYDALAVAEYPSGQVPQEEIRVSSEEAYKDLHDTVDDQVAVSPPLQDKIEVQAVHYEPQAQHVEPHFEAVQADERPVDAIPDKVPFTETPDSYVAKSYSDEVTTSEIVSSSAADMFQDTAPEPVVMPQIIESSSSDFLIEPRRSELQCPEHVLKVSARKVEPEGVALIDTSPQEISLQSGPPEVQVFEYHAAGQVFDIADVNDENASGHLAPSEVFLQIERDENSPVLVDMLGPVRIGPMREMDLSLQMQSPESLQVVKALESPISVAFSDIVLQITEQGELPQNVVFQDLLDRLRNAKDVYDAMDSEGKDSDGMTPEMTQLTVELMQFMGFENAQEVLDQHVGEHGHDNLLQAVDYILRLDDAPDKQEFVLHNVDVSSYFVIESLDSAFQGEINIFELDVDSEFILIQPDGMNIGIQEDSESISEEFSENQTFEVIGTDNLGFDEEPRRMDTDEEIQGDGMQSVDGEQLADQQFLEISNETMAGGEYDVFVGFELNEGEVVILENRTSDEQVDISVDSLLDIYGEVVEVEDKAFEDEGVRLEQFSEEELPMTEDNGAVDQLGYDMELESDNNGSREMVRPVEHIPVSLEELVAFAPEQPLEKTLMQFVSGPFIENASFREQPTLIKTIEEMDKILSSDIEAVVDGLELNVEALSDELEEKAELFIGLLGYENPRKVLQKCIDENGAGIVIHALKMVCKAGHEKKKRRESVVWSSGTKVDHSKPGVEVVIAGLAIKVNFMSTLERAA